MINYIEFRDRHINKIHKIIEKWFDDTPDKDRLYKENITNEKMKRFYDIIDFTYFLVKLHKIDYTADEISWCNDFNKNQKITTIKLKCLSREVPYIIECMRAGDRNNNLLHYELQVAMLSFNFKKIDNEIMKIKDIGFIQFGTDVYLSVNRNNFRKLLKCLKKANVKKEGIL